MTTFDFRDGRGPVSAHRHQNGGGWVADTATVPSTAVVPGTSQVGNWARLGNGVRLGDGVTLGNGVRLGDGVTLGDRVRLGDWVTLGNGVRLGDGVTLGDRVRLGDGVTLGNGVRLGDGVTLGDRADVRTNADHATLGPVGSRSAYLTLFKSKEGPPRFATGCFVGTYAELQVACLKTHGKGSKHYEDYGYAATALWRIVMGEEMP